MNSPNGPIAVVLVLLLSGSWLGKHTPWQPLKCKTAFSPAWSYKVVCDK